MGVEEGGSGGPWPAPRGAVRGHTGKLGSFSGGWDEVFGRAQEGGP